MGRLHFPFCKLGLVVSTLSSPGGVSASSDWAIGARYPGCPSAARARGACALGRTFWRRVFRNSRAVDTSCLLIFQSGRVLPASEGLSFLRGFTGGPGPHSTQSFLEAVQIRVCPVSSLKGPRLSGIQTPPR